MDADAIHILISEVAPACREDFGRNGLENFMAPNTPERISKRIQSKDYFSLICELDNLVVGIISVKNYETIDQLFVHPKYWRQGIARKLWQEAFVVIKENTQASEITVKSSTKGIQMYQSFGFKLSSERNSARDITYYPMSLPLQATAKKQDD